MGDPCGTQRDEETNEFIELYNKGNAPVDIDGWWIATSNNGKSTPDQIVSWETRNPGISLGSNLIVGTTIIQPGQYAVVLSLIYHQGNQPYRFPDNTIILTIANGERLGNETNGIRGTNSPLDTIVLYVGTASMLDIIVSTYGSPVYGGSPESIHDDAADNIPLVLENCYSAERISPKMPDAAGSWVKKQGGTPGSGY
jgi:hypothetical protein